MQPTAHRKVALKASIVTPLLLLSLVLPGCSRAGEALDQARELQEQVDELQEQVDSIRWCSDVTRLAVAVDTANPVAARNLVDALERSGPDHLNADVEVVRAAVQEIEAGDAVAEDLPSDDVNAAVARLVDAVEKGCADAVDAEFGN